MCQSCPPQKLHRTYSKGMVVQIVGKPPRPCGSPRNSSSVPAAAGESLPCSPRSPSSCPSSENLKDQIMEPVVRVVDNPRSSDAKSVKGPGWKMVAGGDHTRLEDGETGESDMDIDADIARKSYQGQHDVQAYAGDYTTREQLFPIEPDLRRLGMYSVDQQVVHKDFES